jgi:hypothetical protein
MADEATQAPEATQEETETVSGDRFREVAKHKKAAEERSKALERELSELRAQLEDRDSQNLPELERERKAREKIEAELKAERQVREQMERETLAMRKTDWVKEAAREANFHNPSAAARLLELDTIESSEDAERAIKKLAKKDQWLVKADEPERPQIGRVFGKDTDAPRRAGDVDLSDPDVKRQMGEDMLAVLLKGQQR